MALIEFTDERGTEWRAWDITPADMHPLTARDMFHGESADYQQGWLVFQSPAERRRLAPYPADWCHQPPSALLALLAKAQPVTRRPSSEASGTFRRYEDRPDTPASTPALTATPPQPRPDPVRPPTPAAGAPRVEQRAGPHEGPSLRAFEADSGRRWTVGVVPREAAPGETGLSAGRALRFTSEQGAVCELHPFPDDWSLLAREHLMALLRRAEARPAASVGERPMRRRDDFLP